MKPQTINIAEINDAVTLKALRGDEYQKREDARATIEQTERNIQALNQRIAQVESAPLPKVPGTGETPTPPQDAEQPTNDDAKPDESDSPTTSELK